MIQIMDASAEMSACGTPLKFSLVQQLRQLSGGLLTQGSTTLMGSS